MKLVKPAEQDRDTPRGVVGGSEISQATTGATNVFMGRFRVPRWLYECSPLWAHRFADRLGGVQ